MDGDNARNRRVDELGFYRWAKDEMNLLEFSFAGASTRADKSISELVYTDNVRERTTGKLVEHRLTMSFSTKYGRPTVEDDEVYVGLQAITKLRGYISPIVDFTRYELVKWLRWDLRGYSYDKIDRAFKRLCGTLLVFDNAFYDIRQKSWVSRTFHLIDSVELYQREKQDLMERRFGSATPKSSFRWSDELFESFVAGNFSKLDLDAYSKIGSGVGKKFYRYANKRLWKEGRFVMDLRELAERKLGYRAGKTSFLSLPGDVLDGSSGHHFLSTPHLRPGVAVHLNFSTAVIRSFWSRLFWREVDQGSKGN